MLPDYAQDSASPEIPLHARHAADRIGPSAHHRRREALIKAKAGATKLPAGVRGIAEGPRRSR